MADYFRTLIQQLSGKLEDNAGVAETLTAAECKLKPFQSEFSYAPDRQRFTNDQVAEDLGDAPDFTAGAKGGIEVGLALQTSGVLGTEPAIGRYLEACGMRSEIVHAITIGAPSGGAAAFAAGDVYSATGGKAGVVEYPIAAGGTLRYVVTSGGALASGDVVTVGSVSATTSSADALYAVKYRPRSFAQKTITIQRGIKNSEGTSSQDYLFRLKGAMGDGSIELTALDVPRFKGSYQGVIALEGAGSLFTGVAYEAASPPTFQNGTVQINGAAVRPDAVSFAFGNSVEMDPDPTTGGGTAGYLAANISGRKPQITITPYRQIVSVLDDLGIHASGAVVPVVIRFGTSPNLIEIVAPKAQIRGWGDGNRAGLQTAQLTLALTRDTLADNEYSIYFR